MSLVIFEPPADYTGGQPGWGAPPPPPEVAQAMQLATEADLRLYAPKATRLEHQARDGFATLADLAPEHEARSVRLESKHQDVRLAEQEVERRPVIGPGGRRGREVSTPVYVVAAVVFLVLEQVIDRSALLPLLLPVGLTHALAIALPVVSLACAHTGGVYLKRRERRAGRGVMSNERNLGIASIAVGVGHALAVGMIRGIGSGLLGGALFAIVALGLFVAMTQMAMRHHDESVSSLERARRAAWWAERRLAETRERMESAFAGLRSAIKDRIDLAQVRALAVDTALAEAGDQYQRRGPNVSYRYELPRWVCDERRLSRGELPPDLRPAVLEEWVVSHRTKAMP